CVRVDLPRRSADAHGDEHDDSGAAQHQRHRRAVLEHGVPGVAGRGAEGGDAMTMVVKHLTREELEAGVDAIRQSPKDDGVLRLIVRRPEIGAREVLEEADLDLIEGLVGDTWGKRTSKRTADGSPHPEM